MNTSLKIKTTYVLKVAFTCVCIFEICALLGHYAALSDSSVLTVSPIVKRQEVQDESLLLGLHLHRGGSLKSRMCAYL
jgi:hypothetical protein